MTRIVRMGAAIGVVAFITVFTEATAYGDDSAARRIGEARAVFEINQGQFDGGVRFASRGPGYTLFLTDAEAVVELRRSPQTASDGGRSSTVRLTLERAELRAGVGQERQPGVVNYLIGRDPAKWLTNVPTFGRVAYADVYPGVDLVYYANNGAHEYDLIVAPGGDPSRIALRVSGADRIEIDAAGNVQLPTAAGTLTMRAPHVYQLADSTRMPVDARYVRQDDGTITFEIGTYDTSRPLVIDPVLLYSTFTGSGGNGFDMANGVAVDASGAAYVAGQEEGGPQDAYVKKFSASGTLVYTTYFGGSGFDAAGGVAVRADGVAYVVGSTTSTNFPVPGAFQPQFGGSTDGFVIELNQQGTAIVRGTYLGGTGIDTPRGVILSQFAATPPSVFGDVLHVYGSTTSTNFPTVQPAQANRVGDRDGFVTVFTRQTLQPEFSSYAGVAGNNFAESLTLNHRSGAMYLLLTRTDDVPTQIAHFTPTAPAGADMANGPVGPMILRKVPLNIGGGPPEEVQARHKAVIGILLDCRCVSCGCSVGNRNDRGSAGGELVGDDQLESLLPAGVALAAVTAGCVPIAPATQCSSRAVLLLYDDNVNLMRVVNFGGQRVGRNFTPTRGVVDARGRVHVIGSTSDTTLPLVSPVQSTHRGSSEGFIITFDPGNGVASFFSYLGGTSFDTLAEIALDLDGNRWIVGGTASADFPVTPNAAQPTLNGRTDAFVVKISADPPGPAAPTNLTAQTNGLSVALSWSAAAGATSYQLEAGTSSGSSNLATVNVGNVTSLQTPGPQGTYFVRVRANTALGLSGPSNEVQFTLAPPGTCTAAPSAPTGHAVQVANFNVTLTWNASPGATSYVLRAGTAPGQANLANVNVGAGTAIAGVAPPGAYFTRIHAVNACGTSGPSNEVSFTLGCSAPPAAPAGMAFSKAGSLLTLGWNAAAGAAGYRLQAGTASGLSNLLDANIGNLNGLQANVSGVPAGTYFVRVVAINACGASGPSNEVAIPIP